jgi:hypothetical protein
MLKTKLRRSVRERSGFWLEHSLQDANWTGLAVFG